MMTVIEAKEYLVANACCQLNKCKKCPFKDSMKCLDTACEDIIEEAIDVVYKEIEKYAKIKLADIKISKMFENTSPNERKINRVKKRYLETGIQDKPIVLNENGFLIDGYVRYLVLRELGIKEVEYIRKKNIINSIPSYKQMPTYYIYGIHSHCKKEFVWRIPNARENEFIRKIIPGDKVLVNTKNGTKSITVTKIELLDKPPIDKCIKKVIKVI